MVKFQSPIKRDNRPSNSQQQLAGLPGEFGPPGIQDFNRLGASLYSSRQLQYRLAFDRVVSLVDDRRVDILQRTKVQHSFLSKNCTPYMETGDNKFLQRKAVHYRLLYGRWIFDYENTSRYIKAIYGSDPREEKLRRRQLVLFGELQVVVFGWIIYDFSFQSKHINPEIPVFLFNPMQGQGRSMIDPQLKGEVEDMFAAARTRYGVNAPGQNYSGA